MKRIAIVFNGDLSINRQGQLNSAICRIKYLKQLGLFDVDAYCVQEYSAGILRLLRKEGLPEKKPYKIVDGVRINIIYKRCYFVSVMLETRLKVKSFLTSFAYRCISNHFKGYNMVSGHSIIGGQVGLAIKKRYGTPYAVTWHGSDIHTYPANNSLMRRQVAEIMGNASANIFVSQSLYETSKQYFTQCPKQQIIYNAADESFCRFDAEKRNALRCKWGVKKWKVVAYVGNMENVKNVLLLPRIFQLIRQKYDNVVFWIIGDGAQRTMVESKMKEQKVSCVFWGNQQPEVMPEFMNCIDVLVLPSKNESFGMVLVEAIACGANAVGSNRGGIPEVIGEDNCFELDETFEVRISERIVEMLTNHIEQTIYPDFDWGKTAEKEAQLFSQITNSKDL